MDVLRSLSLEIKEDSLSSEDDISTDKCDDRVTVEARPTDAGEGCGFLLPRADQPGGDSECATYDTKQVPEAQPPTDPCAVEMQVLNRRLMTALRQMLARLRQPPRSRLDVAQLNRRLAEILREKMRQRDCHPMEASRLWFDLIVRVRRPNAEQLIRLYQPAAKAKGDRHSVAKSGAAKNDGDLNCWTWQFRVRASGTCRLWLAVRPVLERLGYRRFYSVTAGGFFPSQNTPAARGKVEELGNLATVGSLVARGITELFLNFDL